MLERDTDEIAVRQCEIDCRVVDPNVMSLKHTDTHRNQSQTNAMHDDWKRKFFVILWC